LREEGAAEENPSLIPSERRLQRARGEMACYGVRFEGKENVTAIRRIRRPTDKPVKKFRIELGGLRTAASTGVPRRGTTICDKIWSQRTLLAYCVMVTMRKFDFTMPVPRFDGIGRSI
jgi:hypothetical protein